MQDNIEANEIEVKVLEIDKQDLISKLEKLWAIFVSEKKLSTKRFFFEDKDLSFRIRKFEDKNSQESFMTLKKSISNDKAVTNMELETTIWNFETMDNILTHLWFDNFITSSKIRTTYELNWVKFEIDEIEWIPTFFEIEASSIEAIYKYVDLLWYEKSQISLLWEGEVREMYKNKR